MDIKITALDEKIDSIKSELKADIEHLNEKVDLMNQFNERLFTLYIPPGKNSLIVVHVFKFKRKAACFSF